jgi:hypothetical protein
MSLIREACDRPRSLISASVLTFHLDRLRIKHFISYGVVSQYILILFCVDIFLNFTYSYRVEAQSNMQITNQYSL